MMKQCALSSKSLVFRCKVSYSMFIHLLCKLRHFDGVIMCPQRRTWTWTTASGKTSTWSLEPSRCSSVSCQSLCSPSAPSSRSWRPSVSNQHFVFLLQLLSVSASVLCPASPVRDTGGQTCVSLSSAVCLCS